MACALCPRACEADRVRSLGFCGESWELRIASAVIHRGEEPPICGSGGSGAIFITGCNLGCPFCQNIQISQHGLGRTVGTEEFAEICLALERAGAENINLVTGSHAACALAAGIRRARSTGLSIPVLWNSSGYENNAILDSLEGLIDIYLPDLKTVDRELSARFFDAPDYPDFAASAILRMVAHTPLRYGLGAGALASGVIVRHLVIPGCLDSTRDVFRWFRDNCQGRALFSIMTQYTPMPQRPEDAWRGIPNRHLDESEYEAILEWIEEFEIEEGFYQELVIDREWLPDFSRTNPFPARQSSPGELPNEAPDEPPGEPLATAVWHWQDGFV